MNATTRTGLREARQVYAEAMREHDDEASRNELEGTNGAD